jgi:hypothetical protein
MKIKYLSSAVAISCAFLPITLFATENNSSITQKKLDAELNRMEKMHQDYEAELIKMRQMRQDYEAKLKNIDTLPETKTDTELDDKSYKTLKDAIDRIYIYGLFRAKYDHDDPQPDGSGANNKHFYMDLEAKMKVSDNWDAHFQSETRKGYTVNQSWREGDATDSDQDGTLQRIWVEGDPYDIGVELGTKWWGLGFQAVPFGHAADGISLDYDFVENWNAKVFWWRPRQGDLISMPNGSETDIRGLNVTGDLLDNLATSLSFATNDNNGDDQKMSRMAAVELQIKATEDITLTGSFAWTNADDYNTSQEYRIDYKAADLQQVGSYNLYLRLMDFEKYGDYSHDDEWGSLPGDTKGWIAGVKYVLFKNVIWENFYSVQKRNRGSDVNTGAHRDLFRSQIDFHF